MKKFFINDIPVRIVPVDEVDMKEYDLIINSSRKSIQPEALMDEVLVYNASHTQIKEMYQLMRERTFKHLDRVTFAVEDPEATNKFVKGMFKIIKAAGGVVYKEDKVLLIYRLGKWDLPKGKLEKNEDHKEAAVREVEEECNIKVQRENKLCTTWHTYTRNGKSILKKTYWYKMSIVDESQMAPQTQEGIKEVAWKTVRETRTAMYNSYRSVSYVLSKFYQDKE